MHRELLQCGKFTSTHRSGRCKINQHKPCMRFYFLVALFALSFQSKGQSMIRLDVQSSGFIGVDTLIRFAKMKRMDVEENLILKGWVFNDATDTSVAYRIITSSNFVGTLKLEYTKHGVFNLANMSANNLVCLESFVPDIRGYGYRVIDVKHHQGYTELWYAKGTALFSILKTESGSSAIIYCPTMFPFPIEEDQKVFYAPLQPK